MRYRDNILVNIKHSLSVKVKINCGQIKFENMIHLRLAHFETNWDKKIGNLPAFYRVYFWSVVKCFIRYFIVTESSEYTNTHFKLIFIRCHNQ